MYNSRVGRRSKRISNSNIISSKVRDARKFADEEEDEVISGEIANLTPEEIQGLLELLPYKEALIKIAKGEFEIERVEEAEEESEEKETTEGSETEAEEETFEEDEDYSEETSEDEYDEDEDFEEEDDSESVEDSAVYDVWKKRLAGNAK